MTAHFVTPLLVEALDEPDWRLFADFAYESEVLQRVIVVPAGFVTDFASVPRVPLAYWLVGGTANKAACLHDFLYRSCFSTRRDADVLFREAMAVSGIARWRAESMYGAVRTFGAQHYCKSNRVSSGIGNTKALGLAPPPPIHRSLIRATPQWNPGRMSANSTPQSVKEITQ